jgi:hypothetical protein
LQRARSIQSVFYLNTEVALIAMSRVIITANDIAIFSLSFCLSASELWAESNFTKSLKKCDTVIPKVGMGEFGKLLQEKK